MGEWKSRKNKRNNKKNNYLNHRNITSYESLVKEVDRSVSLYNQDKPHIELKRKSPIEFENNYLCTEQKTSGSSIASKCNLKMIAT